MSGLDREQPVWERVHEVQMNVIRDNTSLIVGGFLPIGPDRAERDFLIGEIDVSCDTCIGACCVAGMRMTLNQREFTTLKDQGTGLEPLGEDALDDLDRGKDARFLMTTNCAFLSDPSPTGQRNCTIYDDPRRPRVCPNFEAGDNPCRLIRAAVGVDPFMRATYRLVGGSAIQPEA